MSMDITYYLINWYDLGFLLFAGFTFWKGYLLGKRMAYRQSYQNELNNKMEEFLIKHDKD